MNNSLPLLGITGYSGSGKTTLLEKLLPQLIKKGLRVSVIKHSHHNAHVDKEGKDSWRMKEAGSAQVIMACDTRWALMTETPQAPVSLAYLSPTSITSHNNLRRPRLFHAPTVFALFIHVSVVMAVFND